MDVALRPQSPYQGRIATVRGSGRYRCRRGPSRGRRPAADRLAASIAGTPARMLAGDGKLLVVTAEGMLYCFGETPALSRNHPARPIDAAPPADTWTTRAREILEQAGVRNGYCLALGLGSGRLVEELRVNRSCRSSSSIPTPSAWRPCENGFTPPACTDRGFMSCRATCRRSVCRP